MLGERDYEITDERHSRRKVCRSLTIEGKKHIFPGIMVLTLVVFITLCCLSLSSIVHVPINLYADLLTTEKASTDIRASSFDARASLEFSRFVVEYNKEYSSEREKEYRYSVFKKNLAEITLHNSMKEEKTVWGINHFSDLTINEFKDTVLMKKLPPPPVSTHVANYLLDIPPADLPKEKNWTAEGCVQKVKNQAYCGSCWTFASIGAVESHECIKSGTKELLNLSEQELVDCGSEEGAGGCNGGWMFEAFATLQDEGGVCTEEDYPYTAKVGSCKAKTCKKHAKVLSYSEVPRHNSHALMAAVATKGPVAVAMSTDARKWANYKSGIIDGACSEESDHALLITGYGTDPDTKEDYWIFKNSWTEKWGERGYGRLLRQNTTTGDGECGVLLWPIWPDVGK